jgi:hypothetical protein
MFYRKLLVASFLLMPVTAFSSSKDDPLVGLNEKIKPFLVHISPTQAKDKERLPMGCTGFFINADLDNKPYTSDEAFIITNLSCLLDPTVLNSKTPSVKFIDVTIQDYCGDTYPDNEIIGFHQVANLVLLKVKADRTSIRPIGINKTRPLAEHQTLYSIRFPSVVPNNDLLTSTFEKSLDTKIDNIATSYLLHQGATNQVNGFEGSPIVGQDGQVIGINSYSNFYFFNIGFDLAPMIQTIEGQTTPKLSDMVTTANARNYQALLDPVTKGFAENDAFDETLYLHRAMQPLNFEDWIDLYFNPLSSKLVRLRKRTPEPTVQPPLNLFYFQAMDYMMDYTFDLLLRNLQKIETNKKLGEEERNLELKGIKTNFKNYFTKFWNVKNILGPAIASKKTIVGDEKPPVENPFLKAYQAKMDCKYEAYQRYYTNHIQELAGLELSEESRVRELCDPYMDFLKKYQKENFKLLKSEPYESLDLDHVLEVNRKYLK